MKLLHDAPLLPESLSQLRRLYPEIEVVAVPSPVPRELLADADVLYTQFADFDPAAAPNLKWVQIDAVGTKPLWDKPVFSTPIPICNAIGAYSVAVAECAFAMLLALSRKITSASEIHRQRAWPTDYDQWLGIDLHRKTLGILGYGGIGRQIARLAQGFGMTVLACKRQPDIRRDDGFLLPDTGDPEGQIPAEWYGTDRLNELLPRCDVLVITLPETPATMGLMGASQFAAMKPAAYLINVGRGTVVDEPALINALKTGQIAGAGLDVVTEEPLPPENPLWDAPNVLILPHVAAWTDAQAINSAKVLIENLRRDRAGEPLLNVIDKQLFY